MGHGLLLSKIVWPLFFIFSGRLIKTNWNCLGSGGQWTYKKKLFLLTECFFFQKQNIDGIDATPPTTTFWVNQNITPIISKIKYFFTFFCARQIAALVRPLVLAPRSPLARPLLAPRSPLTRPSFAPFAASLDASLAPRSPLAQTFIPTHAPPRTLPKSVIEFYYWIHIFLKLLVPNLLLWIFLVSSPPSTSFVSEATKSFALAVYQVTNSMAHLRGGVFSVFWLVLVSKGFKHI